MYFIMERERERGREREREGGILPPNAEVGNYNQGFGMSLRSVQ